MIEEMKLKEILDAVEEKAYFYEKSYHGCSQSTLAALQDIFDMKHDDIFQSASGLANGIGLTADSACGGLSGGTMFISQICGRKRESDGSFLDKEDMRFLCYKLCALLAGRFFAEYDSGNCHRIQEQTIEGGKSYALKERETWNEFVEKGWHSKCAEICGKAARWTAEIVLDNTEVLGLSGQIPSIK